MHAGQVDEAVASLKKSLELDPNFWMPHLFLASAYIEKGMYDEAVAEARIAVELLPSQTHGIAFLGYALARSGKHEEARAALQDLLDRSTKVSSRHTVSHLFTTDWVIRTTLSIGWKKDLARATL
jgi:tetratricopeptide (TPR) repeat protein